MVKAFTPITQVNDAQVQAPTKIDTPQYPDKGVAFANYSKTPQSGNQFILNPQTPVALTHELTGLVGINSNTMATPEGGKRLYITSMQVNTSITAADVNSYVELVNKNKIVWKTAIMRSETNDFQFSVPLIFDSYDPNVTPSGFVIIVSSGAATINKITINLQGWIE